MDMNLSKFQEMLEDRWAWHSVVHRMAKSRTHLSDWMIAARGLLWTEVCLPELICCSPNPQDWEWDRTWREVFRRWLSWWRHQGGALVQQHRYSYKRKSHIKTQGEGDHLQAKERGLGRNQTCLEERAFLAWKDPLEEGIATHSSILAWRIQWTEGPGGLQSIGSQRVGHDWSSLACMHMWKWESLSHVHLCDPMDCGPWNPPGQNPGVGNLSLVPGIFPTQGSNPGLAHCKWILYQLSHRGSPRILEWVSYPFSSGSSQPRNQTRVSCIVGGFFTNWIIREASACTCRL